MKAKLFWKIFLSDGEFGEKRQGLSGEKNRVVIFSDKNLEVDNCRWIEQELRRLQTWEVFLIKSSSKSSRQFTQSYIFVISERKNFSHGKCCGSRRETGRFYNWAFSQTPKILYSALTPTCHNTAKIELCKIEKSWWTSDFYAVNWTRANMVGGELQRLDRFPPHLK